MSLNPEIELTDPHGHLVHLCGQDDPSLVTHVTRYLAQGLQRGDSIVVVATPEHTEAFATALREESCYARAVLEGRVVWLDAQTTLDRFMINGEPHWSRFLEAVGNVLRDLQERAGGQSFVRAYGEMVGLLWLRGQHASAARLEDYWNRLLEVTGCDLFCAYPVDVFSPEFTSERLHVVLSQHTHVVGLSEHLEAALNRAIEDVLGTRVEHLPHRPTSQSNPEWAAIPPAEALVLWLRRHFRAQSDEILGRAHDYYLAASA